MNELLFQTAEENRGTCKVSEEHGNHTDAKDLAIKLEECGTDGGIKAANAAHDVVMALVAGLRLESASFSGTSSCKTLANSVTPVGWPTVGETLDKLVSKHVQIYACGACSRPRGVTEADLNNYGAKFGSPTIFVSLIAWADHVATE